MLTWSVPSHRTLKNIEHPATSVIVLDVNVLTLNPATDALCSREDKTRIQMNLIKAMSVSRDR